MNKWEIDLEWIEDDFLGRAIRNNTYYEFRGSQNEDGKVDIYMCCKKNARDARSSMNKKNPFVGMISISNDVEGMIQKFLEINDEKLVALENFGNRISYNQIEEK